MARILKFYFLVDFCARVLGGFWRANSWRVWREFGGRILANARAQGAPCVAWILKFGEFLVQISR